MGLLQVLFLFFFNDTATTEIYTLSLHDALPIWRFLSLIGRWICTALTRNFTRLTRSWLRSRDRKSTRLNSSHQIISYAVFCLKKNKSTTTTPPPRSRDHAALLCDHHCAPTTLAA